MDVVLINPPSITRDSRIRENLGLAYIHSSLPPDITVHIIDARVDDLSIDEVVTSVISLSPKIVGISCSDFSVVPSSALIVEKLRAGAFYGHICFGGHGAVACKGSFIKNIKIDSLCLAEGEHCFSELVGRIIQDHNYFDVEGFWFRMKNGDVVKNNATYINDIDILPFPTRKLNPNQTLLYLSTTRGCPRRCSFCDVPAFYQKSGWRSRSVSSIIMEIEELVGTTNIRRFHFSDDNFIGCSEKGRERALLFANEVIRRNLDIEFSFEAHVRDISSPLFIRLKEAGLVIVNLGIETPSGRMLKTLNKRISKMEIVSALDILKRLNIECKPNLILYDMYSNIEEMDEVYHFFKDTGIFNIQRSPLSLYANGLAIFPNTHLEKELEEKKLLSKYRNDSLPQNLLEICNFHKAIFSYQIVDETIKKFVYFQEYWAKTIHSIYEPRSKKTLTNAYPERIGYVYLKMFRQSIDLAKDNDINIDMGISQLNESINKFCK